MVISSRQLEMIFSAEKKTKDSNIDPSMKSIAEKRSMSWGIPYIHPENVIDLKTLWNLKFYKLFDENFIEKPNIHEKAKIFKKDEDIKLSKFWRIYQERKFELPSPNRVLFQFPYKNTHTL